MITKRQIKRASLGQIGFMEEIIVDNFAGGGEAATGIEWQLPARCVQFSDPRVEGNPLDAPARTAEGGKSC